MLQLNTWIHATTWVQLSSWVFEFMLQLNTWVHVTIEYLISCCRLSIWIHGVTKYLISHCNLSTLVTQFMGAWIHVITKYMSSTYMFNELNNERNTWVSCNWIYMLQNNIGSLLFILKKTFGEGTIMTRSQVPS
jgi:hypothetical protein